MRIHERVHSGEKPFECPTSAVGRDFQTHLIAKSICLSTLVDGHTFANSLAATNAIRIPALYASMPWRIILPQLCPKPIKKFYKQCSNVKISEDTSTSRHKFSRTCCCCCCCCCVVVVLLLLLLLLLLWLLLYHFSILVVLI